MAKRKPTPKEIPVATPPPPAAVDAVASFVETAEDLAREPFMAKDENQRFSFSGNQHTYNLGDRTHFRSALISFRRLIMPREESSYKRVCDILFKHHARTRPKTEMFRHGIQMAQKQELLFVPDICAEEIIDLWINTVFAHSGLKPTKRMSRTYFDELAKKYGIGSLEYSFRNAVSNCSWGLINLCQHAARPALDDWASQGLNPSFSLSSPFGRKTRERLPDGTIVIRQASSKYFTDESLDRRFLRILKRSKYSELRFVFENLEASDSGKCLLAIKAVDIREILNQLDISYQELSEKEEVALAEPDGAQLLTAKFKSATAVGFQRSGNPVIKYVYFGKDDKFHAGKQAITLLNQKLAEFIQEFKDDE